MPEGPEIRRAADRVAKALVGRQTTDVWFAFDHLEPFQSDLTGAVVTSVEPRGKAMVTMFETGQAIYSHNQLYGRWYVMAAGRRPKTNRQLRVAVHNTSRSALLYSASEVEVLEAAALEEHPYIAKLGPDPLADAVDLDTIQARVSDETFARRQLAGLLLDQSFIAGLGNYLRSEILFEAGAHPFERPGGLGVERRERLARAVFEITTRAYETRGVTNGPAQVEALKAEGVTRRGFRFAVFGRDGRPCYRCQSTIERLEAAGRRAYVCPSCQAEP